MSPRTKEDPEKAAATADRTGDGNGSAPTTKRSRSRAAPAEPEATSGRLGPDGVDQMRLTGDRIMVRMPEDRERRSKAGLLIPATAAATHKRCIWSDVVLVGPETRGVRSGDLVLFIPQSGIEVEVDGEAYLLLRERDVQAVASERIDRHAGQYL